MNKILVDLDDMKDRKNMFESILLGSKTLPTQTSSEEKEEIGLNSKGKRVKSRVESMKSGENADFEEDSSVVDVVFSNSSYSSEDSLSDSGKESDDELGELFGSLFGEKKRDSSPNKETKKNKNRNLSCSWMQRRLMKCNP